MASIKKNPKTKKWDVRYDAGFKSNGERNQKFKGGFLKREDAETFLTNVQYGLNSGTYIDLDRIFVFEYLDRWLESEKSRLSPTTYSGYEVNIRCHINPIIGGIRLQELRALNIKELYSKLQRNRKIKINDKPREFNPLSSKSILYVHRVLSKALEDALKDEIIHRNPAKAVTPPKLTKHKAKFLESKEIKLMLEKFKDDEMYIPVFLSVVLGLRRGEVLGLRWENINFDNKVISICEQYTMADGKPIFIEDVKSDGSKRDIVVTDRIINILKAHKKSQKKNRIMEGKKYIKEIKCNYMNSDSTTEEKVLKTTDFVCTWQDGSLFNPSHISRSFKIRMKNYGLPEIKFHELRHSNGALMITQNVQLKGASERLGHSTIAITNDLYGHVEKSVQQQIAETIDSAIWGTA